MGLPRFGILDRRRSKGTEYVDALMLIFALLIGLAVGGAVVSVFLRRSHRFAIDAALASAGADAKAQLATAETRLGERDADVRDLRMRLDAVTNEARTSNDTLGAERVHAAGLAAQLHEERESAGEKLALLTQARDELAAHFKALAGDALEVNRMRMTEQHRGELDLILKPLGEKLSAFEKKVDETYDKEAQQRFSLKQEVLNLQLATAKINEDAINLTRALKGEAKTRGNWGEVILERVLERSGLVKGVEYDTQHTLKGDDGSALRPDVIVHLPDSKHIVIDSKVSLVAYDRYYASVDDEARALAGRQHVDAVRGHAKALGEKKYQTREGLDAPDFVAMFVPIEPALGLAAAIDPDLFLDAWDRKVVIVTPSTLLATLTTVRTLWQREKQTRNAIDIARQSGLLYDQFALVIESLEGIGVHLDKASKAFESTRKRLTEGKGNVVRRIEQLREMGAKASKALPSELVREAADNDDRDNTAKALAEPSLPAASSTKPTAQLTLVAPPSGEAEPH